jgi:Mannosyltransferase (PIG-V)
MAGQASEATGVAPALRARARALAADPAVRDAWRAFWVSRLVVWAAGLAAVLVWGLREDNARAFDPTGLTRPFGALGDDLVAPGARWDAVWFLRIAADGYGGDPDRAAFFPLYPLLVRGGGTLAGSPLVAAIAISLACFLVALVLLHRLVALDFGRDAARLCVLLVAVFPGAVWFSSAYSESLFLALSVGAVYAARTGRWEWAGAAGALAAATRSAGVVLVVPLAVLWWRGARRPRDAAWIALVPAGLAAFCAGLAATGQDALAPFDAQEAWLRTFAGPLGAVPDAVSAGWQGARDLVAGTPPPPAAFDLRWLNVGLLATLAAVLVALAGALRRLPLAYGLYAAAALTLPLSFPVEGHPLMSLPRFAAVLWPLHLWLALWLLPRGAVARRAAVAVSVLGLAAVSGEVASWGWVA